MNKRTLSALALILLVAAIFVTGLYFLINGQVPQSDQAGGEKQPSKSITVAEVGSHNSADDCWTIISGQVYNLTQYINRHPGGESIIRACGIDATTLFTERQTDSSEPIGSGTPHSRFAENQLSDLMIGTLAE